MPCTASLVLPSNVCGSRTGRAHTGTTRRPFQGISHLAHILVAMTGTMKALLLGRGPEWVLDDVPVPRPGPGDVLIRNSAAATNNADLPMLAEADPTHGGHGNESIAGFEYDRRDRRGRCGRLGLADRRSGDGIDPVVVRRVRRRRPQVRAAPPGRPRARDRLRPADRSADRARGSFRRRVPSRSVRAQHRRGKRYRTDRRSDGQGARRFSGDRDHPHRRQA